MDQAKNKSYYYCKLEIFCNYLFLFLLISFLFIKFKMLDKIEIEMEIADPLREYTSSQNSVISKEPISA
jgi:hypothetical protein